MNLVYPLFLLGLFSIAVPIAIHFFELRKPQRILFTNVSFIKEVKLITARQRRLKHFLILIARIGFLVFLVLMFCQPFLPAPKQEEKIGNKVSVVVDTSPSMQALSSNEQPIFDQAVQEASSVASIYPATTQFQLSGSHNLLTKSALLTDLAGLSISAQTGALESVIARTQKVAKSEGGQTFVFSDFQKNYFSPQLLAKLDSTRKIFLVPIAGENTHNVFVDSITLNDAFIRQGVDITLQIRLCNGGSIKSANCQVKVFVGERQAASYRTDIEANSAVTTAVQVRLSSNELQRCRVEVEDFPVTFDNTYYFSLLPSPQVRIVDVVVDEPATQRVYANEALFLYVKNNPRTVNYSLLENANLVVLQQPQIDAALRNNIKRLVERGGSVVVVPPVSAAGRASYSQLFHELGIGSVQWEPITNGTPTLRDIAAPSPQNPFFRDVFVAQNRQTVMPKASPVLRWSRSGTDILRFQDGEGYLASFNSGRGTVYLFSAPFEERYSDFTNHALFVPVMYRLAMQSFRNDQQLAYRLNQRTVVVNVPEDTNKGDQVFKLTKDSLIFIPAQRLQAGELRFDVPPGMQSPGFYQLTHNGRVIKTLAFNVDKKESELARYSADELRNMIGANHPNVQVYEASAGKSVAAQYQAERVGTPLWQYCLWAALACLLAEVLLLRFMNGSRKAEPALAAA